MNYESNEIDWPIGSWVIHDCDAKERKYLMLVVGKTDTEYICIYPFCLDTIKKDGTPAKGQMLEFWTNYKKYLHDPARFDIEIPGTAQDSGKEA